MANYCATTRTNYFRVTDEDMFCEIIDNMTTGEGGVEPFAEKTDGEKLYGFGCYGSISGLNRYDADGEADDEEPDYDRMIDELQAVVHPDDAIIIMEAVSEKLRYLTGFCTVITRDKVQTIDMNKQAVELAREMLGNPDYKTKMEY